MTTDMKRIGFGLATALLAGAAVAMPLREWDWHLPVEVYKTLDFADRAGVDRAVKLFERAVSAECGGTRSTELVPLYRNAANEWRKIQVKGESDEFNAELLAYSVFMQGYSYMQAHDRNKAQNLFNEVLDLYADQKFVAIPARYMVSQVKRSLGEIRQADEDVREIIEDKGADGHIIYYLVLRDMANIHWKQKEVEETVKCWEMLYNSKGQVPGELRSWARESLIMTYLGESDYPAFEGIIFSGCGKDRKRMADIVASSASSMSPFLHGGNHAVRSYLECKFPPDKKATTLKKACDKVRQDYWAWFEGQAGLFAGEDDGWRYALLTLHLYAGLENPEKHAKRFQLIQKLVRNAKPDQINGRVSTLIGLFLQYGQVDAARESIELARGIPFKLRLYINFERGQGNLKKALQYLEELMGLKPPPDNMTALKWEQAGLYSALGDHDRAVKIYQEINQPPRTLWAIASELRAGGKKDAAYMTMNELTFFPNEAPSAVLQTARWREQDGQKDKAIGLYRQLLKNPEWKKLGHSSTAHQALERLGVATGGAMTNEVR